MEKWLNTRLFHGAGDRRSETAPSESRREANTTRLAVTKDLTLALKYLRHPHEERILWIDALCINQENHE